MSLDSPGKVSIITRAYNRLEYTIKCINSVRNNTRYPNYEHIIINNHSLDGTKAWLNHIQKTSKEWFPNMRVFHLSRNLGDWRGMVQGMQYISPDSKYIVQLDNDIDVPVGWLTAMVETLETTGIGVVTLKRTGVRQALPVRNIRLIDTPSGTVTGGDIDICVACYLMQTEDFKSKCTKITRGVCDGLAELIGRGCFKITSLQCHQMEGWDGESYVQHEKYNKLKSVPSKVRLDERVSIVIPIIRPKLAEKCVKLIHKNAGVPEDQYEIVSEEDVSRIGVTKMVKKLVDRSKYDLVMFIGDDIAPQKDFLKNAILAMRTLPGKWGLVGLNDGVQNGAWLATHWLGSKKLLPHIGGEFFHTGYWHICCDMELTKRARDLGRYVWARNAIIKPVRTPGDADKRRAYSREWKTHDHKLFKSRRESNWGEKIISVEGKAMKDTKEVSIVISNRNDLAMLAVTVRSCIEELKPLGKGNGEIVICDNSDHEIYRRINSVLPIEYVREGTLKICRQNFPCLFTARETAIKEAEGEYIICLDSHVLVGRDMIVDLVDFMHRKKRDKTVGFAHAPISWAHQHERSARHDRDMSVNELGNWGGVYDHRRMISWKGMPWICRRKWFLDKEEGLGGYGALAEHKLSWGGGDMHIGIKPWLLGFKNWAVPTSPAIHIGPFPNIDVGTDRHSANVGEDKYRLWSKSGEGPHCLGFLVSCYVLGGEPMMKRNKAAIKERFGQYIDVDKEWTKAIELGRNEKNWLNKRRKISFDSLLKTHPWGDVPRVTRAVQASPMPRVVPKPTPKSSPLPAKVTRIPVQKDDWRSRIREGQERLKIKQSMGARK